MYLNLAYLDHESDTEANKSAGKQSSLSKQESTQDESSFNLSASDSPKQASDSTKNASPDRSIFEQTTQLSFP